MAISGSHQEGTGGVRVGKTVSSSCRNSIFVNYQNTSGGLMCRMRGAPLHTVGGKALGGWVRKIMASLSRRWVAVVLFNLSVIAVTVKLDLNSNKKHLTGV